DAPASPIPDRPRLTCVGRLCADKGQLLLVDAVGRLAGEFPDLEVVLVGNGDLRSEIEDRIRTRGLGGRIQLRGALDGEGVRRELLESRCLVLPSLAEGLPVVIMEAMALGRPVISTLIAGIPELVRPEASGWLVPSGNLDLLVEAARQALRASADHLARLGGRGREMVLERHDSRKEASRLAGLFRATREAAGAS
ncbi:MAG TPA: glycosyltransferase, partial [Planctomycetota bacterium]|nr:glycosyltransferase [Planctomycetota bacterium]